MEKESSPNGLIVWWFDCWMVRLLDG